MDPISHALWAYVAGKILLKSGIEIQLLPLIFFAVIPDIILIPFGIVSLRKLFSKDKREHKSMSYLGSHIDLFTKTGDHIVHSFIFMSVIAAMAYFISRPLVIPILIGWGILHITFDIFVHNTGVCVTPFYPASLWEAKGVVTWYKSRVFMIVNAVLLIAAIIWINYYI